MKQLVKTYFQILSAIAPTIAGNQAFELFQRPLNMKIRAKEKSFFRSVKSFYIKHDLEDIECYELGPKLGKLVLLVHGWESNAASMSSIGLRLAQKGYHVILFNLPAHGFSKLKKSNLKLCKEALLAVIAHINPKEPFSVVAHSFGSAVTAYTLSKGSYKVQNLVFLASPNKISKIFDDYSQLIGLNGSARQILEDRATRVLKEPLRDIMVTTSGQKINYDCITIIHDEQDKIVPKTDSIDLYNALDRSNLHWVNNKGHYRMLWDQEVIDLVEKALQGNRQNENQRYVESVMS